jgi:hypothetical protein
MIGKCEGNQIYDTSMCIDCNAECVGADRDPQRRGQFIEKECSQSANDYVCKPCTAECPVGTFVSTLCTGKGRTDTGCSICRSFCAEALVGVVGAHGQYIDGFCDGKTTSDVQRCKSCKQCPTGYYPTKLCSGLSFSDTVECIQCRTECPAGFYLKGDCRVEEVKCVPCDQPCANQSKFLQEKRACTGGLNRQCEPTTKCKDASCPPGYYESATCTDPNGPKFCTPCQVCSPGQYQSTLCTTQSNRVCTDCTSECPDAFNYIGIVGSCDSGFDTIDAVSCVPAFWGWGYYYRRGLESRRQSTTSTTVATAGGACGENEWYVGARTPMYTSAPAQDLINPGPSPLYPFKSDFSPRTFNTIVYLGVVGTTADTRQTTVSVYTRASASTRHYALATFKPRANYFERLDYYGSQRDQPLLYPMASTTDWNAVDVMLSHDEASVYVFFSYTFDFIGKCSLSSALSSSTLPYSVPAAECTYLSTKSFVPTSLDAGVTGSTFTFKGCTRMHPLPFLACLYDLQSARSLLYVVDETTGAKTVVDSYRMAYDATGDFVGRPKSPPTWDPVNKRVFFVADIPGSAGGGASEMGLRYVRVTSTNFTRVSASGILWRGSSSDSASYHSLVYTIRYVCCTSLHCVVFLLSIQCSD